MTPPWTIAHQALLSLRFPRQEYWSGLPFPPPGDLPDSGTEPASPALAGRFFTAELVGSMLLLLLSRFSHVRLCATSQTAAHQAPPSLGFSRQEYWSGLHFLLQCVKVKSESEVAQLCLTLQPHGLQPTRLLCPWDSPGKSTGVGCHCLCLLWVGSILAH